MERQGGFGGRGGHRGGQGGHFVPRERSYPMGWNKMQDLKLKESNEILLTIVSPFNGFDKELEEDHTENPERLALILCLLARAFECTSSPKTLIELAGKFINSKFIKQGYLSRFLATLTTTVARSVRYEKACREALIDSMKVFKVILTLLPTSYIDLLTCTVIIKSMCERPECYDFIEDDVMCLYAEVDSLMESVEVELARRRRKKDKSEKLMHSDEDLLDPPSDFSQISIFPKLADLHLEEEPFLRANKAKGKYLTSRHYLDVQFRLIREDFIAPLREGIQVYLDMKSRKLPQSTKLQNIRVYENTTFIGPVCTYNGIAYKLQFDVERFKHVNWQFSKRFIYGSLLCLSMDNFNTMYFCTVVNRNPDELKQGQVDVVFENEQNEILNFKPDIKFCMAETLAYFEAYRHVLTGLQKMAEEDFSFQKYIVKCERQVGLPLYLQPNPNVTYDMSPLAKDAEKPSPVQRLHNLHKQLSRNLRLASPDSDSSPGSDSSDDTDSEDVMDDATRHLYHIPILDFKKWPSARELKLDDSQYGALQNALCKEFSIIQGPPGTGKTFLGWKIVQVLLKNQHLWNSNPRQLEEKYPILIVCYTNHALDQFLEGIQQFYDKNIVRVGNRSKSKTLEKHSLNQLRQTMKLNRHVPAALHIAFRETRWCMNNLKSEINKSTAVLTALSNGIISQIYLESVMEDDKIMELNDIPKTQYRTKKKVSPLTEWLGLGQIQANEYEPARNYPQLPEGGGERENHQDEEENIDVEDEIDRINEQRLLEDDEDDDESKTKKEWDKLLRIAQREVLDGSLMENFDQETEHDAEEPWQENKTQRRKKIHHIKQQLKNVKPLSEQEVGELDHLWTLPMHLRFKVYKYWETKYKGMLRDGIHEKEKDYHKTAQRQKEVRDQLDLEIMRGATVLGMTTTGAARYHDVLQEIKPKIIIVEEAAEVLEAHVVTTLSTDCEHLILIGDHKQLKPSPTVHKLARHYNLDLSLFERMVNNGVKCVTLANQHRMRPEISALLSPIYPELLDDQSVLNYEKIKGVSQDLYFIHHTYEEAHIEELKSKSNHHEASFAVALCRYLLLQGYEATQITILTTYSGQLFKLKKLMPKKVFQGVRVSVVDNFQGEENDIIILSLVRSNSEGSIGFLNTDNRVCVSLSRAKKGFYVIGNFELLQEQSQLWNRVIRIAEKNDCYGTSLPLYCQSHPQKGFQASTAKDFEKAPEGGCMLPCETRLACGHVCPRACHTYDKDHTIIKCQKRCDKVICDRGHMCSKKCSEECGDCLVPVKKLMPLCHHEQVIACHKDPLTWSCKANCGKQLICGHLCQNRCGDEHTTKCNVIVERKWPCGHQVKAPCHETPQTFHCMKRCTASLECEHDCLGTCGSCMQGCLHEPCKSPCKRILVCGHVCREPCTKDCPPCKAKCQNQCYHSRCIEQCGKPCVPCKEPCIWSCQHYTCTMCCSEPCNRPPCNQPCQKLLNCGHRCIGLCGEPCPDLCRICQKEDVESIFFGNEDEPGMCFIQLEDCHHLFEVSGLDHWMESSNESEQVIKLKQCPRCSTVIRRNLRYSKQINAMLNEIEKVKLKVYGDRHQVELKRRDIRQALRKISLTQPRFIAHVTTFINIRKITTEKDSSDGEYGDGLGNSNIVKDFQLDQLSLWELAALENLMNFFTSLTKLKKKFLKEKPALKAAKLISITEQIEVRTEALQDWVMHHQLQVSPQEATEFVLELKRTHFLLVFAVLYMKAKVPSCGSAAQRKQNALETLILPSLKELQKCSKLKEDEKKNLEVWAKKAEEELQLGGLGITDEERLEIVKAMGLTQGHWYKCRNGHVYAIGDCGGATLKSICPECKETIGGENHTLVESNAVATEMDGARHSAWSEEANMANYAFI